MPLRGANIPVEFVWTTAIAMPLLVPSYMLNLAISYNVAVALSLPSSVITICSPAAADLAASATALIS
jgi:hypothetical protein